MPATIATAPGKIILFGEHAVVYGQPAIAIPVKSVKVEVIISAELNAPPGQVWIHAPLIGVDTYLNSLPQDHPIARTIHLTLQYLGVKQLPGISIRINSSVPVAAGLGSGAAVSVALIRGLAHFLDVNILEDEVNPLAFEVEKLFHGTPSGVDNTVVTYARPIYFVRGQKIQFIKVRTPFSFVIADTGIKYPTAKSVGDVRTAWQQNTLAYNNIFKEIGSISKAAKKVIQRGNLAELGPLMDQNHDFLRTLTVSSPQLDHLVESAWQAGALGAKLSGGGRGGNIIALASPGEEQHLAEALMKAGAERTIITIMDKNV